VRSRRRLALAYLMVGTFDLAYPWRHAFGFQRLFGIIWLALALAYAGGARRTQPERG
jgi:hypothetical protein